jgi:hypothetical protein
MRALLEQTAEQAITYLERLGTRGIAPTEDAVAGSMHSISPCPRAQPTPRPFFGCWMRLAHQRRWRWPGRASSAS